MSNMLPLHGFGGGVPLNFKVLAYATEEARMAATPAKNTIGVITDTKITSWILSPSKPEKLAEGELWIKTEVSSPAGFNALKNNCIQINPVAAKQHISGELVEKIAYLYTNTGWVQVCYPTVYLYKNGDRNIDVTGDYHKDSPTGVLVPNGTAEDGTKFLNFYNRDTLYKAVDHSTGNKIDVTPFKYLVEKSIHGRTGDRVQLVDDEGNVVAEVANSYGSVMETLTLNISKISGSYYIRFHNYNLGNDNWDMYELYLSPE